jgi:hypothetical protein
VRYEAGQTETSPTGSGIMSGDYRMIDLNNRYMSGRPMQDFDFVRLNQQTTGGACLLCNESYGLRPAHGVGFCVPSQPQYGSYQFTPNQLTADEVRKIVREEIERAIREAK